MKLLYVALLVLALAGCKAKEKTTDTNKVNSDRWLELDIYWFNRDSIEGSSDAFFDRYAPMFQNVTGWKGIIINIGWVPEYIFQWDGDLNKPVPMPQQMHHWDWFDIQGIASGSTSERMGKWHKRFASGQKRERVVFQPWTYNDLKNLASSLKGSALKHGIEGLKVGGMSVAWENIYDGESMPFTLKHPEIFRKTFWNIYYLPAKLKADTCKYAVYPNGIPEGTPFTSFFGKQWGHLSKSIGFDAFVFRDSYIGSGVYARKGPHGLTAPADPKVVESYTNATADLIKQAKMANPNALTIGYSNGASAVGEWRVNCVDLESIAKQGYLDAYIEQTWGACFSETAMVKDRFWNKPNEGYTYQLAYTLLHAAQLAETKTRHYVLINTWDAWESWDVLHTVPERVRWEIWAYHHAAVKTPNGLKMPGGSYISWCSRGKRLLSGSDVAFLSQNLNDAIINAQNTKEIYGPTLVYSRNAMEWQNNNKPNVTIKEWIDEQAAGVMKWSLPILSVTRAEYLPKVTSDLFILQTPVHLSNTEKKCVLNLINSGSPVAIFASPAGGIDPEIASLIGVSTNQKALGEVVNVAEKNKGFLAFTADVPNQFKLYQPFTNNTLSAGWQVIYSVNNSPALAFNTSNGKKLLFWDPAEISVNFDSIHSQVSGNEPMDSVMGSIYPFMLASRGLNHLLALNGALSSKIEPFKPLNIMAWQLNNGQINLMASHLEEGINHTADLTFEADLTLPGAWFNGKKIKAVNRWYPLDSFAIGNKWNVQMPQAKSALYQLSETN